MGAKGEALAKPFQAKAQDATAVLEKLSDADWKKTTAGRSTTSTSTSAASGRPLAPERGPVGEPAVVPGLRCPGVAGGSRAPRRLGACAGRISCAGGFEMRLWLVAVLATPWLWPIGGVPAGAQPRAAAPAPDSAPLGRADHPVWNVGDEWTYRWESPRGKGSFTWVLKGEEVVDGVAHYVTASGARETYWQRSDLGFHFTTLEGNVEERATPPRRDYAWPLTAGKSWEYIFTRERPLERQSDEFTIAVVVEREETVTVPAGTFQTFKLVQRNKRTQAVASEWWYAPVVKSFVRQRIRRGAGSRGAAFLEVRELVAFKLAGPTAAAPAGPKPAAPPSPSASPAPPLGPGPTSPSSPSGRIAPAPGAPGSALAEFSHKITYRVTGTAQEASITYRNARGGTQQTAGRIPWEVSFDSRAGNFLYVLAQNQGASGSVSCDILVDGEVMATATSTGAYVIAECSEAGQP